MGLPVQVRSDHHCRPTCYSRSLQHWVSRHRDWLHREDRDSTATSMLPRTNAAEYVASASYKLAYSMQ